MIIKPLHDNVVIKQQNENESNYGRIVIPDMGKEKSMVGIIIAVGPGRQNMNGDIIPTTLKIGEKVAFPSFGGQRVFIEQEEYLIYKEADIFAVIDNDETI